MERKVPLAVNTIALQKPIPMIGEVTPLYRPVMFSCRSVLDKQSRAFLYCPFCVCNRTYDNDGDDTDEMDSFK